MDLNKLEWDIIAVVVALFTMLVTTIFLIRRSLRRFGDTVILVGLCDSGKTHVFSKILNAKSDPITYTSLQENIVELDNKGKPLKIVDFPGAERLRKQLMEKWLKSERSSLKKIVFVVDSASFSKRARDVAEFLYDVALESNKQIPITIACNKQDLSLAKTQQIISSTLEKEIGLINKSRAAALTTTDGSSSNSTLTDTEDAFQWTDLPKSVDFVDCSAVGEPGLDELREIVHLPDDHPQKLIYHLSRALIDPEDINLDAYCDLWLNLCKFIQAWGYLLRFVTDDVTVKVNAILVIRAENAQESETFKKLAEWEDRENKMRKYKPKSGTANVLVLHRAMLFVMDLIDEVYQEKEDNARVHVIASRVYDRTLSRYHKFLIRAIVPTAFRILPSRGEFVSIMRGPMDPQKDEEFHSEFMKLSKVLHQRVAVILEQYEMTEFTKYNE